MPDLQSSPTIPLLQTLGCDDPQAILHLFRTNDPPTDSERAVICDLLQKSHTVLQNTHTQKQRQCLKDCINFARAILHPIRLIPREIIAEIVLHALNDPDGNPMPATLGITEGPWPYSHICSLWRDVVVSYPKLWSVWEFDPESLPYLDIDDDPDSVFMKGKANIMRIIVDRSKDESIHVTLGGGDVEDASPIMDLILGESNRWQHADILCDSKVYLDMLNDQVEGSLNRLESLDIVVEVEVEAEYIDDLEDVYYLTAFGLAPRLTTVTLDLTISIDQVDVALPWSQVLDYREPLTDDADMDPTAHVDILRRLHNVVYCELSPSFDDYDGSPITLPHMRTLVVGDSSVLDLLTLPALETLDLGVESGYLRSVHDLFHRSHCALQELMLGMAIHEPPLPDLLRDVPTLRSLVLYWSPYYDDLIAALTITDDANEPPLVPMLSRLSIHAPIPAESRYDPSLEEPFMLMVESRRRGVAGTDAQQTSLKFVSCDFDYGEGMGVFSEGLMTRAEKLREGGLEIILKSSPRPE